MHPTQDENQGSEHSKDKSQLSQLVIKECKAAIYC